MSTFEGELANLLRDYDEGLFSEGEVISLLIDRTESAEVDAVVSATPEPLRDRLIESLCSLARREGPYVHISGAIYDFELELDPVRRREKVEAFRRTRLEEQKRFETIILPKIRAWAQQHIRLSSDESSG